MRPIRVSIAGVMGLVAIAALGCLGLREGTETWASLTFGMTALFLLGATLTAAIEPANRRAGWLGFALFGWAYLAWSFLPGGPLDPPSPPGDSWIESAFLQIHPVPPSLSFSMTRTDHAMAVEPMQTAGEDWVARKVAFLQIIHSLGALLFAAIGAAWACWLARRVERREAIHHGQGARR